MPLAPLITLRTASCILTNTMYPLSQLPLFWIVSWDPTVSYMISSGAWHWQRRKRLWLCHKTDENADPAFFLMLTPSLSSAFHFGFSYTTAKFLGTTNAAAASPSGTMYYIIPSSTLGLSEVNGNYFLVFSLLLFRYFRWPAFTPVYWRPYSIDFSWWNRN